MSEWNALLYKHLVSPWITAIANPLTAEVLKRSHPMRVNITMFSEQLNPWMLPLKTLAPFVAKLRMPVDEHNRFVTMEATIGELISGGLDSYRRIRDAASERLFAMLYGNG